MRALITGVAGQDGSYLAEFLLRKGYEVWGTVRKYDLQRSRANLATVAERIELVFADLKDFQSLDVAIRRSNPDEIYNLAAQSNVPTSWSRPDITFDVNVGGLARILDCVERINPKIKVYQASTSEMLGGVEGQCDENTAFVPVSPYGASKLAAHTLCDVYRRKGIFAVCGLCFNHESPRRGPEMVTRKITKHIAKWAVLGNFEDELGLGNLDACKDWGFAGDYVEAMWSMLQLDQPENFVIGTGVSKSVRDFVTAAIKAAELNPRLMDSNVFVDPRFVRATEVKPVWADTTKAKTKLGWQPKVSFDELVAMMIRADIRAVASGVEEHETR